MRTRLRGSLVALAALATLTIGLGSAAGRPAAMPVSIDVASNAALGQRILVTSSGLTLYHFTAEKGSAIACTGGCRSAWPPLLIDAGAKPAAGAGVDAARLGTIKRPVGGVQVTYDGLALYRFVKDTKAGQVTGQGYDGSWYAITPSGSITRASLKAAVTSSSASSGATSSSSSSSDSGGYGGGG